MKAAPKKILVLEILPYCGALRGGNSYSIPKLREIRRKFKKSRRSFPCVQGNDEYSFTNAHGSRHGKGIWPYAAHSAKMTKLVN